MDQKKEQKMMQLDNDLRQRQEALQENVSECGDWRMAKAFENLLSTLSSANTDEEFLTKLKQWVKDTDKDLKDHITERVKIRAEINEIQAEIAKEEQA